MIISDWCKSKFEQVAESRFARRSSQWVRTGSWDDNQGIPLLPHEKWSGIITIAIALVVAVVVTAISIFVFVVS